jgi:stage III sporulation protein SpoIIIAA
MIEKEHGKAVSKYIPQLTKGKATEPIELSVFGKRELSLLKKMFKKIAAPQAGAQQATRASVASTTASTPASSTTRMPTPSAASTPAPAASSARLGADPTATQNGFAHGATATPFNAHFHSAAKDHVPITLADLEDASWVQRTIRATGCRPSCALVPRLAPGNRLLALALAPSSEGAAYVLDIHGLEQEANRADHSEFKRLMDRFLSSLTRPAEQLSTLAPVTWITHSCGPLANGFYLFTNDATPPAPLLDVQLVVEELVLEHPRRATLATAVDMMVKGIPPGYGGASPASIARRSRGAKDSASNGAWPAAPGQPLSHSEKQKMADEARQLVTCAGDEAFLRARNAGTSTTKSVATLAHLACASALRWDDATRRGGRMLACFDKRHHHHLRSPELLRAFNRPEDVLEVGCPEETLKLDDLLALLPASLRVELEGVQNDTVDVVLDIGKRPYAKLRNKPYHFLSDCAVDNKDVGDLHEQLEKRIGPDSRAGLPQSLHRISFMYDHSSTPYGVTLRVGRSVRNTGDLILDLLRGGMGRKLRSILVLGKPGSGKTSVLRDLTRKLAEENTVLIVDTSNEIAGDDMIPHPDVGMARRMMVPSVDKQHSVMVEAVQNHTPDALVVDEVGRHQEVLAAKTVVNRGVALLASAHGDLRTLHSNPDLRGLCGDTTAVIKPGGHAVTERTGRPIFDVVVELEPGRYDEWVVVTDVAAAVDAIISGGKYEAERRERSRDGTFVVDSCWR